MTLPIDTDSPRMCQLYIIILDSMHCRFHRGRPSSPGGHAMVSSVAVCCVRPTAHALLCIVNGDDSAVFRFLVPCNLDLWPLTLTSELERGVCTFHPTAKFHRPIR